MKTLLDHYLDRVLDQGYIDHGLKNTLTHIAQACLDISQSISQAAIDGVLTSLGQENVQGEVQKTLDVLANQRLLDEAALCTDLAAVASEEMDTLIRLDRDQAPYLLLFDPLDGSSNIEVNVSIGTIFSILPAPKAHRPIMESDFLQSGQHQVAAGYAIYGPQTLLVLTIGQGVVEFSLDKNTLKWVMVNEHLTITPNTQEFAINMSNMRHWAPPVQSYIQDCLSGQEGPRQKNFNMRWIAAMVGDVHRILHRGGIFMYPWDKRSPGKAGKLRLMYEANPMSFLVEQAGGVSMSETQRIMEIQPTSIHQRVSVSLGSKEEVNTLLQYYLQ